MVSAPAYASTAASDEVSTASANKVTPADLPVKSIPEVKAEAAASGLDQESTDFAVELQKVINAYHELPADLQGRPTSDPEVEAAINQQIRSAYPTGAAAAFNWTGAMDCGIAVADAASIVVPGANAWKWVKAAGGVISFADAIKEYLDSKREDALVRVLGKEAGNQLNKVLGYKAVIENCT